MIRFLAVLLLVQIVAVGALYWPDAPDSTPAAALVRDLQAADVQRLEIVDAEGASNTLTRGAEGWTLASGLPADPVKVDTLLAGLVTGDPGFAVATSDAARTRFKVDAGDFERRIVVDDGAAEQIVYLGSSPSFRKVHARRDGEAEIHVIELNSYDAPTDDSAWLDRSLLAVEDPAAIELYGLTLVRGDEGWSRDDGAAVDPAAVEQLVQALANLRVSGLVEAGDEDAAAAGEALRLTVSSGGDNVRLTVLDNPELERYYLRSEAFTPVFNTSAYDAERLIDAARAAAGRAEGGDASAEDAEEAQSDDSPSAALEESPDQA